jgi:tetratricopeptide (TPR) repeat protein
MKVVKGRRIAGVLLSVLLAKTSVTLAQQQQAVEEAAPPLTPMSSLDLAPEKVSHLSHDLAERDYVSAETLLLDELKSDPNSARSARLLAYVGSVYFLNHDYLNAAIAWKKSEAIAPLDPSLQFSLAMAYIGMGHRDWARKQLMNLAAKAPKEPIYPYWLGRLDYDAQLYTDAMGHFREAIALAPGMARAYDNLGLCYFYLNQNAAAVENFQKAIDLSVASKQPSAWPYLNLAVTLQFLGKLPEAESNLHEAIKIDPQLAPARYRLGNVLEDLDRPEAAIPELVEAAKLDANYAEPHIALARIYYKLGRKEEARNEVTAYQRIRASGKAPDPPAHP